MPYFHEPDPQTNLDGKRKRKKNGATVFLSGRGRHFEAIRESLEQWAGGKKR